MPWFEPNPPEHGPDEDEGLQYPDPDTWPPLTSQQFIVTDNPVVGVLFGADGETVLAVYHERDDRFGFSKWAEDR